MSAPISHLPEKLTPSQREALICLLGDEDPAIYQTVEKKLLSYGHEVVDWLKPHLLSDDVPLRQRVRGIIQSLEKKDADNEFLAYCLRQGEALDLEDSIWLLARTRHPDFNPEGYSAILDAYAGDIRERLDLSLGTLGVLNVVTQYLFRQVGFVGNEENYYDPDNSYLNRVIDRKTGNPISLCVILILVSKRLNLPIQGVGLPGHFICRYHSPADDFYIDAFNRGRILRRSDCVKFLHHTNRAAHEEFLASVSTRKMLARMCGNLYQIYQQTEDADNTLRFQQYLAALGR